MEIYILSLVSAFVGYFSSILANKRSRGVLQTVGIIAILTGFTLCLTYFGQWIAKPAPPPHKLEGQWIEKYKEGEKETYSIAKFKYNSQGNYLEYSGTAYASNLTVVGYWRATQARFDNEQYDYLFEGESKNPTKPGHREGVGSIYFDNINHGSGKFLAVRDDQNPRDMEIDKILNEDAIKESTNDPKALIQKLYTDPNYFRKITSP